MWEKKWFRGSLDSMINFGSLLLEEKHFNRMLLASGIVSDCPLDEPCSLQHYQYLIWLPNIHRTMDAFSVCDDGVIMMLFVENTF